MKKIILLLVISIIIPASLICAPEFWLGAGFNSGKDYMDPSFSELLQNNDELISNELYSNGKIRNLNLLGPSYEFLIFPYAPVKIGLYLGGNTAFIIGENGNRYKSHNWDLRQNARIGIAYNQFFGNFSGFFLDVAFDYSWYRIANSNEKNLKIKPTYSRFEEMDIYTDFGYVLKTEANSWFKVGFAFRKPITNKGWSLDLAVNGGVLF